MDHARYPRGEFRGHITMMSLELEVGMWQFMDKVCYAALNKYPTTLQQDINLLNGDERTNTLTYNERNCVTFRKGEKMILNFLLDCS